MKLPLFLKKEDKIGIVAPARFIEQNKYENIISTIENKGFQVVRGTTTYLEQGPFAGTDAERLADLQEMIDSYEISAIFCLRGGYGTIRIIDDLNFERFIKHPKWMIGFSDITIMHNKLHKLGIASIHGQMPLNFAGRNENKGLDTLFEALSGKLPSYLLPHNKRNKTGNTAAEIVGGNVAILSSLIGTNYDLDCEGKILFIEEVGEYLYRFDRLMHHLKMSGKLSKLAGLVVGGLSDMKDNDPAFGQSAQEIVADLVSEYNYPLCFDFPAGHIKENFPLVLGQKASLKVTNMGCELKFK